MKNTKKKFLKIGKDKYPIYIASTFWQRFNGLMHKKNINYGMLFKKCNSIHTYFMKENIDVLGLDQNNEVIYKYENLDKNRIIKVNNNYKKTSILEMPVGSTKKIKLGTIILFSEE